VNRNDIQKWAPGLVASRPGPTRCTTSRSTPNGGRPLHGGLIVNSSSNSMFTVDFLSTIEMLRRGEREALEGGLLRAAKVLKASSVDFPVAKPTALMPTSAPSASVGAVNGLLPLARCSVRLFDKDITGARAEVIVVHCLARGSRGRRLFGAMKVRENLELGAYSRNKSGSLAQDLERTLDHFPDLESRLSSEAGTLSGSQQQWSPSGEL
jgi:hypothetical protein